VSNFRQTAFGNERTLAICWATIGGLRSTSRFSRQSRPKTGRITPRLALETTLHQDRYRQGDLDQQIEAYDRRRAATQPYRRQRAVERWGEADFYGWSEDKARQYAEPLRQDFGAFVRAKGFCLD